MKRFPTDQRSPPVAVWLFGLAFLVLCMVVVGGATRLTHSGLSITQWKPIRGVIPPLNPKDWADEFARYQQIPQYKLINHGMSLAQFQVLYWWEWAHRLLGRIVGVVFAVPFLWFLIRRELPRRLIWRCVVLFALGGLQGLIGWWMVVSGLEARVSVAPERLAIHLGAALILFVALIWTGLEALAGESRGRPGRSWVVAGGVLFGMAFVQCLLGALVAGNQAGLVYTDWPMMNGRLLAPVSWKGGAIHAFLHDQALVQFDHRLMAYALVFAVTLYAVGTLRTRVADAVKLAAEAFALIVWAQAGLGVATLMNAAPLGLAMAHQTGAVLVLAAATFGLWRVLRIEERGFTGGLGLRSF
jgi:cytochrome c oxidase assembly protein subunit 15